MKYILPRYQPIVRLYDNLDVDSVSLRETGSIALKKVEVLFGLHPNSELNIFCSEYNQTHEDKPLHIERLIQIAKKYGYYEPLTLAIIERTLEQMSTQPHVDFSINISLDDLAIHDF